MRRLGQIRAEIKTMQKQQKALSEERRERYDIQKTVNKMAIVSTSPIVIILDVNEFNSSINRHRLCLPSALLQGQSSTNPHRVTHGERWPSCTSLCSSEGGVGFLKSSTTPCISTGIIHILMAVLGSRRLAFIMVYLFLLYQIYQMMPSRLCFFVNYHLRFMNEQKTRTHTHKQKPVTQR